MKNKLTVLFTFTGFAEMVWDIGTKVIGPPVSGASCGYRIERKEDKAPEPAVTRPRQTSKTG